MATDAPSADSRRATAAPMPRLPPVISALLPASLVMVLQPADAPRRRMPRAEPSVPSRGALVAPRHQAPGDGPLRLSSWRCITPTAAPAPAAPAPTASSSPVVGTEIDQLPSVPSPTVTPRPPDLSTPAGQA